VIAGTDRGRKLHVPPGDRVRPTKDMVREALFSALDARGAIVDASVLDLYAGSGALAIEALSRGAARAVLVEKDRAALTAIGSNIAELGLTDVAHVAPLDVDRFLMGILPREAPFDLVFVDPPYETSDDAVVTVLTGLARPGWLGADAIVAVERPIRHPLPVPDGWRTGWEREFGDTLVSFCFR